MKFQPIVGADGTLLGFEALHDSEFNYSLFDGSVRVLELERRCFEEALKEAAKSGLEEKLFINFSMAAMAHYELSMAEFAFSLLNQGQVVLEVTETTQVAGWALKSVMQRVRQARRDGFLIAIDDFGSGNSLKLIDLEPDFIKIDLSIVQNCHLNSHRAGLIRQIAGWQSDRMSAIAEGIEDEKDYRVCKNAGVRYFQGFYIGKPGRLPVNHKIAKEGGIWTSRTF